MVFLQHTNGPRGGFDNDGIRGPEGKGIPLQMNLEPQKGVRKRRLSFLHHHRPPTTTTTITTLTTRDPFLHEHPPGKGSWHKARWLNPKVGPFHSLSLFAASKELAEASTQHMFTLIETANRWPTAMSIPSSAVWSPMPIARFEAMFGKCHRIPWQGGHEQHAIVYVDTLHISPHVEYI